MPCLGAYMSVLLDFSAHSFRILILIMIFGELSKLSMFCDKEARKQYRSISFRGAKNPNPAVYSRASLGRSKIAKVDFQNIQVAVTRPAMPYSLGCLGDKLGSVLQLC